MNKNDLNYKAYQFASSKKCLIDNICENLFFNTNIKIFAYFRFLQDGRYMYLCNHLDWVAFCLKNVQNNNGTALGEEIKRVSEDDYHAFL